MSVPPATPRFATPRRALAALLIIVGAVAVGLLAAPVQSGKPSESVAVAVARDVAPVMYLDESGSRDESSKPRQAPVESPVCALIWRTDDRGVMWVWVPVSHAAVYLPDANGVWLTTNHGRTTWVWITDSADSERTSDGAGEWITYDGMRPFCGHGMPNETTARR